LTMKPYLLASAADRRDWRCADERIMLGQRGRGGR
jgi:hypothetical protein